MQAVILVAGNSTRMHPLSVNKHKSLLKVAGKRIIEHQLDALTGFIDEAILVVSPSTGGRIKNMIGDEYKSLSLKYVVQHEPKGTLHAVQCAEPLLKGRFVVLMGDDLYGKSDLSALSKQRYGILACEVPNPSQYGVIVVDKDMNLVEIIEKPAVPPSNLVSTGAFVLDRELFNFASLVVPSHRGEFELGDAVKLISKNTPVKVVRVAEYWKGCSYPWDLLAINELLLNKESDRRIISESAVVECNVVLKGFVSVGAGTIIKSGTYIEGPVVLGKNCIVGPNVYLRGTTAIGDNCRIGKGSEIKNSIVGDCCSAMHDAFIGDSIVGEYVNFGKGATTANLRNDEQEVKSLYKNQLVGTGRAKFGAVISDYVKLGCNTVINPGRKLWPNITTEPNEVVTKDKVAND